MKKKSCVVGASEHAGRMYSVILQQASDKVIANLDGTRQVMSIGHARLPHETRARSMRWRVVLLFTVLKWQEAGLRVFAPRALW